MTRAWLAAIAAFGLAAAPMLAAQNPPQGATPAPSAGRQGGAPAGAPAPAGPGRGAPANTGLNFRTGSPIDLAGTWVSLVTDDWRYRMLTPPKGNVDYLPITPEGRRVAGEWDPARDEAAGEQCRAYGAIGVMRMPGRLRVGWENDTTLKVETDAGTQTRRFHFGTPPAAPAERSWQGVSAARWVAPINRGRGPNPPPQAELRVTTTQMRPGYIRKNGVPYSADAVLTEHFVRLVDDDGTEYLALTQMVEDPVYFNQPIVRTMMFRKQRDNAGWAPTPCSAR